MILSVIIPIYNEQNTIYEILCKINEISDINKEVIIVDDGSNDHTRKILKTICKNLYTKGIFLEKNYGKGYACRQGILSASGNIVIIQDADLEYNPQDYKKLIQPILEKKSKVVYGSRVLPGAKRIRPKKLIIKLSKIANHFLTALSNLLNKQSLTDAHTCYKVFDREVLSKLNLIENGFNFCPEVTAKVSKLKIKIFEVPIDYNGRSHEEGKKIKIIDGFKAIYAIIKYNL